MFLPFSFLTTCTQKLSSNVALVISRHAIVKFTYTFNLLALVLLEYCFLFLLGKSCCYLFVFVIIMINYILNLSHYILILLIQLCYYRSFSWHKQYCKLLSSCKIFQQKKYDSILLYSLVLSMQLLILHLHLCINQSISGLFNVLKDHLSSKVSGNQFQM